jgi:hypothetical protein
MTSALPQACPHERVEPRGLMSSFAGWEGKPPKDFRDYDVGYCYQCHLIVRRHISETDWHAFMTETHTQS